MDCAVLVCIGLGWIGLWCIECIVMDWTVLECAVPYCVVLEWMSWIVL